MKEQYFTSTSCKQDVEALHQEITVGKRERIRFNPSTAALLLLDLQQYFLSEKSHAFVPSAPVILPSVLRLADLFLKQKRPVFVTQHVNSTSDAAMMGTWWGDLLTKDHEFCSLHQDIIALGCPILQKTQYDAFYRTHLDGILHENHVKQVVICGVMTHLCCETTARSAFVHGFEVIFPVDGTATYTRSHHAASLRNLAHGFAQIPTIEELLTIIRSGK